MQTLIGTPDPDDRLERLVEKLVASRKRQDLTQAQVADRMGVSQPALAKLESGQTRPQADTLLAWMDALGMDVKVEDTLNHWSGEGVYVGDDGATWVYRSLPSRPLDWEDEPVRLEQGTQLREVLEGLSTEARRVQLITVSWDEPLRLPGAERAIRRYSTLIGATASTDVAAVMELMRKYGLVELSTSEKEELDRSLGEQAYLLDLRSRKSFDADGKSYSAVGDVRSLSGSWLGELMSHPDSPRRVVLVGSTRPSGAAWLETIFGLSLNEPGLYDATLLCYFDDDYSGEESAAQWLRNCWGLELVPVEGRRRKSVEGLERVAPTILRKGWSLTHATISNMGFANFGAVGDGEGIFIGLSQQNLEPVYIDPRLPTKVLVVGQPGAGKTTFAEHLLGWSAEAAHSTKIVRYTGKAGDEMRHARPETWSETTRNSYADWCKLIDDSLELTRGGWLAVEDADMLGSRDIKRILEKATEIGVRLVMLGSDPEKLLGFEENFDFVLGLAYRDAKNVDLVLKSMGLQVTTSRKDFFIDANPIRRAGGTYDPALGVLRDRQGRHAAIICGPYEVKVEESATADTKAPSPLDLLGAVVLVELTAGRSRQGTLQAIRIREGELVYELCTQSPESVRVEYVAKKDVLRVLPLAGS